MNTYAAVTTQGPGRRWIPEGSSEARLRRRMTPTTHSPTRAHGACGALTRVTVRRS